MLSAEPRIQNLLTVARYNHFVWLEQALPHEHFPDEGSPDLPVAWSSGESITDLNLSPQPASIFEECVVLKSEADKCLRLFLGEGIPCTPSSVHYDAHMRINRVGQRFLSMSNEEVASGGAAELIAELQFQHQPGEEHDPVWTRSATLIYYLAQVARVADYAHDVERNEKSLMDMSMRSLHGDAADPPSADSSYTTDWLSRRKFSPGDNPSPASGRADPVHESAGVLHGSDACLEKAIVSLLLSVPYSRWPSPALLHFYVVSCVYDDETECISFSGWCHVHKDCQCMHSACLQVNACTGYLGFGLC